MKDTSNSVNELQIFNNPEFGQMRSIVIDNEPWFVGKDVAVALGYSNHRDALYKHVDSEDKGESRFATPSGEQMMTIINESGLYSLVFSSKLESAKKFKHWVTSEVLPALRKTGHYGKTSQSANEVITDNQIRALEIILECPPEKLPYLGCVLKNSGYTSVKHTNKSESSYPIFQNDYGVSDFLQNADVLNRATSDVYKDYCIFCSKNNIHPVAHNRFSRQAAVKNINGKSKRIFAKKLGRR